MRANNAASPTATGPHAGTGGVGPVAAISRRDGAAREVRRAIVRGDLTPGQRITEAALSEDLGVSRPTVREALAQLVNDGLLVSEPYRGIRVATLSAQQMEDTARVRTALDELAISLIVQDGSGTRLEQVHHAWQDYVTGVQSEDALARHETHVQFHRRLWEASGNTALVRYWPAMEAQISLQLALDQQLASDALRDIEVHRRIVDAIAAGCSGDMSQIRPALEAHTWGSIHTLIASREA